MQLPTGEAAALAGRCGDLGYTVEGLRARLGDVASEALDRDEPVPARRVLAADPSPLATLARLFLLGDDVPVAAARAALAGDLERWGGLLRPAAGDAVQAAVELAPHGVDEHDWWLVADWPPGRTGRPAAPDHVLGVGGAATMLAQCTVRPPVERALDLGTGCGIQAFHLTEHAASVVATDLSPRALAMGAFNAALNGFTVDWRHGDLLAPVAGERFDLVVSNPPFVIAAPEADRHDYRDSGLPGDEICARIVRGAAGLLTDGGWCQLLANWEIRDGDDWTAAPRRWLAGSPLDAWVVQRDVQDPAAYVATWLRDAGAPPPPVGAERYEAWLAALEERRVVGIGFGLITLRAGRLGEPVRRLQHAPQPLVQPVGPQVAAWFGRQDLLRAHPGAAVLGLPLRPAPDVVVDLRYRPGQSAPEAVVVRRETGFAWSGLLDGFGRGVLDRADGTLPIGEVVASVAAVEGVDVATALGEAVPVVRHLVEEGFLETA